MNITIWHNESSPEVCQKKKKQIGEFENVTLKNDTSIITPTFQITAFFNVDNLKEFNYVHWNKMGRWYFVNDIRVINGNMFEIDCRVDVLMSFYEDIRLSTQRVRRHQDVSKRRSLAVDPNYVINSRYEWAHDYMTKEVNSAYGYKFVEDMNETEKENAKDCLLITSGSGSSEGGDE